MALSFLHDGWVSEKVRTVNVAWLLPAGTIRSAGGPDVTDTRLLTQPAIGGGHIAFIYAADLWMCDLDGRNVRRLTGDLGRESNPAFSPDGSQIAYISDKSGEEELYLVDPRAFRRPI